MNELEAAVRSRGLPGGARGGAAVLWPSSLRAAVFRAQGLDQEPSLYSPHRTLQPSRNPVETMKAPPV